MMKLGVVFSLLLGRSALTAQTYPELSCRDGKSSFQREPPLVLEPFHGTLARSADWSFGPFDADTHGFERADIYLVRRELVEETSLAPGGAVHALELAIRVSDGSARSWWRLGGEDWQVAQWLRVTADAGEATARLAAEAALPLFHVEYPDHWSGRTPWGVRRHLLLDLRGGRPFSVLASLECATLEGGLGACGAMNAPFDDGSFTACAWSSFDGDLVCEETTTFTTLRGARVHRKRFFLTSGARAPQPGSFDDPVTLARAIDARPALGSTPGLVTDYGKLELVKRWQRGDARVFLFVGPIPRHELMPPVYLVRLSSDGTGALDGPPGPTEPVGVPAHDPPEVRASEAYSDETVTLLRLVVIERSREYFTDEWTEARSLLYVGVEPAAPRVDAYFVATTGSRYVHCGSELRPATAVLAREDWRSLRSWVEREAEHADGLETTELEEHEPACSESGEIRWVRGKGFSYRALDPCVRRSRPRSVAIDDHGGLRFHFVSRSP